MLYFKGCAGIPLVYSQTVPIKAILLAHYSMFGKIMTLDIF